MLSRASTYHFVTEWTFDAPIDEVWAQLNRPEDWPNWWRGVVGVELIEAGAPDGTGAYRQMIWRSALPYRLRFNIRTVRLERPSVIEGRADGELCGVGRWSLSSTSSGTTVRYDWDVEATKQWMRWLAPVAKPLFAWNHRVSMRWGFEGLRRRLAESRARR
jgi:uncharacterized protein YndB with AHSA1/START domain